MTGLETCDSGGGELSKLILHMQQSDPMAGNVLRRILMPGMSWLARRYGDATNRIADEVWTATASAIASGEISDVKRMLAYIRFEIKTRCTALDNAERPVEAEAPAAVVMETALASLSDEDREILKRFYVWGQPEQKICDEMGVTVAQCIRAKNAARTLIARARKGLKGPGCTRSRMQRKRAVTG